MRLFVRHGIVSGAMNAAPEDILMKQYGDRVELMPNGELDLAAVPALRSALQRALASGARSILVDMSTVTFLDSTGLNEFVDAWREAGGRGVKFALTAPAANIRRVLDITNLGELLDDN